MHSVRAGTEAAGDAAAERAHNGHMSVFDRRPGLRWAVPAGTAALIVIGAAAAPLAATADSGLPPRTAAELLVALQESAPVPVSGTVATRAELGLPELPMGMAPDAGPMRLASGEGTVRLWSDGPTRQRLALIDDAAETTVVRNGDEVWVWSSAEATATRYEMPEKPDVGEPGALPPGVTLPSTPQEAAEMALAALDPTTEVTTSGLATVAGRDAYELVLTPRDPTTLVRDVRLFLDAETTTPLRVQVNSTRITDPAFQVGFTSVDFGTPDPALFTFTPPPGATVQERDASPPEMGEAQEADLPGQRPTVVGEGWTTVLVGELPGDALADLAESGSRAADEQWGGDDPAATALALLEALPATSGDWGSGRVLAGTLFTVILTDDGRFAVGAVGPEALGAALAAR